MANKLVKVYPQGVINKISKPKCEQCTAKKEIWISINNTVKETFFFFSFETIGAISQDRTVANEFRGQ